MQLSIDDLFLIGVALDMTGAWLLARGLMRRLTSVVSEVNAGATLSETGRSLVAWASDRADAEFGVPALVGGFFVQALGYFLITWRDVPAERGLSSAVTAAALGLAVVAAVVIAHAATKRRRVFTLLGRVIVEQHIWHKPGLGEAIAHSLGERPQPNESDDAFVERIFAITLPPDPRGESPLPVHGVADAEGSDETPAPAN